MARPLKRFVCQSCGAVTSKWSGRCESCGEWNTIVEEAAPAPGPAGGGLARGGRGRSLEFAGLRGATPQPPRYMSGIAEFDRVCGGGLVTGSALLIAIGQARHLLGVQAGGNNAIEQLWSLLQALPGVQPVTAAIGLGSVALLLLARRALGQRLAGKLAPMAVVVAATVAVALWQLDQTAGVRVVGAVPAGLPTLGLSWPGWHNTLALALPALLISLVGFVESVSVAQSLALRRRERILPDKELLGLGAANLASALSGGYPVTGGFARSVVNFEAGARTPLAGVVSALLMAVVLAGFAGWFHHLPQAVLAATIVVAVLNLIDLKTLREAWHYD
ncbi:MAG: hypothetical protein IBJ17_07370, partial [Reyranella sp.]|nr:hypothetical protein [Reyranella sp.]